MRAFICAYHFACAQWLKKVDKNNKQTWFKAANLVVMILSIQLFLIIIAYDYTILSPLAEEFRFFPLLYGGIFYIITTGFMLLILGGPKQYNARVKSKINKSNLGNYILAIKINLYSCLFLFILGALVNFT